MTGKENSRRNILILDPERDTGELFARALETSRGFKCYLASAEDEVMSLLRDISFTVVLADLSLIIPGDFSLLRRIRHTYPQVVVIVDAYLHQKSQLNQAMTLGAHGYILKPIKVDVFRRQMDEFCDLIPPAFS